MDFTESNYDVTRILLITIFVISIIGFMSIQDVFAITLPITIPMGAAGGAGNFDPDIIKIQKGDTVKWTIFDRGTHTVTSDSGLFDSGSMQKNVKENPCYPNCEPFSYTFNTGGAYNYHCKIHSWMQGSVVVEEIGYLAETKIETSTGSIYLEKKQYGVSEGRTALVKIYGYVEDPGKGDFVLMTITDPDGKTSEHKVPATSDGYYQNPMRIHYDERGKYSVSVKFQSSNIGTVTFEVVKASAISQLKEAKTTSIILNADSETYEKGSTIGIAGQLIPYQKKMSEVTIQIISPNGNIVRVDQLSPDRSTGTFSTTINTAGELWKLEGDYKIKASYEGLTKFTTFDFTIPPTPISKTPTILKLDSIPSTFKVKRQNSEADVVFSGKLTTNDRKYFITNAVIHLKDTRFGETVTVRTNDNGEFSVNWKWAVGNNYGVYAVYDGSSKYESSKSQTEYFTVKSQAIQSQPSTRESSSGGSEFILILIIAGGACAGVVAVLLNKNKAKPSRQESWLRPVDHSPTSTPKPASQKPSITLFCTKCGTPIRPTEKFCTKCGKPRPK